MMNPFTYGESNLLGLTHHAISSLIYLNSYERVLPMVIMKEVYESSSLTLVQKYSKRSSKPMTIIKVSYRKRPESNVLH